MREMKSSLPQEWHRRTIGSLLAQVTEENLHGEVDTGPAVGNRGMVVIAVYARNAAMQYGSHSTLKRAPNKQVVAAVVVSPVACEREGGLALLCPVQVRLTGSDSRCLC